MAAVPDDPDDLAPHAEPATSPTQAERPSAAWPRVAEGTPTVEGRAAADRQPGEVIGGYRVVGAIASGGFGTVYQAEHVRLGRAVAIKVLHADGAASREVVTRFEREAQLVNLIRHPNVVDVFDFGELDDGRPYFVMELLRGVDLRELIARDGAMPIATALELLAPLCDALDAAHAKGVVHRDIKPSNVFVATAGDARRVVLLDFGVAKLLGDTGPSLTRSRQAIGTPTSMAPEQVRGEAVDARTDVYALGSLAYTMLTGRQPFAAETAVVLQYMHLFADPPRASHAAPIDPRVDDVIVRAMAKDPAGRPASAGAFLAELRAAFAAAPPTLGAGAQVIVAVVTVHLPPGALATADDPLLDTVDLLVCEAASALAAAGFATMMEGVDRVVLQRPLDHLEQVRAGLASAAARLRAIDAGTLTWSVAVHVGAPDGRDSPHDLGAWLPAELTPGLVFTPIASTVLGIAEPGGHR